MALGMVFISMNLSWTRSGKSYTNRTPRWWKWEIHIWVTGIEYSQDSEDWRLPVREKEEIQYITWIILGKWPKLKEPEESEKQGKRERLGREPKWYFQSQRRSDEKSLKEKSSLKRWWLVEGSCQMRTEKAVELDRKEVLVSTNEQFPGSGTYISQGSIRAAKLVGYICCL